MAAILALLSSLSWGTADFLGGFATRKLPSIVVVATSQAFGLVTMLIVTVVVRGWEHPAGYVGWGILASISGFTGLIAFYKALSTGAMGVVSPISGLAGLVPLAAGLLAGERLAPIAAIGACTIFAGIVLASGPELSQGAGTKPLLLATAAGGLFGVSLLAIARGSQFSPVMTMTTMRITSVTVLSIVLALLWRRRGFSFAAVRPALPLMALIGALDVLANLAYGQAAAVGSLVIVAVLGSIYPVVTAILAAVVLRERLKPVQYVGCGVAVLGLMLLAAR